MSAHVAGCSDDCSGTQIDRMWNETYRCPCACHHAAPPHAHLDEH